MGQVGRNVKKVKSIAAIGVAAAPGIVPLALAGNKLKGGGTLTESFNAGLAPMGLGTDGSVDIGKMVTYGIFTGGCIFLAKMMRASK